MVKCKNCQTEFSDIPAACEVCRFPFHGTDKEQAAFIASQVMDKREIEDALQKLKNARLTLFVVAAYFIVVPFTPMRNGATDVDVIFSVVLGLFFLGFAFLTFRRPLTAVAIPLGLVIIYYLLLLLFAPVNLYQGVLWKMIVLISLGYGYFNVRKANRILKENKYLASLLGYGKIRG